jgi:uncharacterized protein VirK/YbjX
MPNLLFLPSRRDIGARIKDNLKLLLGAIVYPVQSRRWRSFVRANLVLSELAQRYPRITHKIYRPYLCGSLTCADRVDVLIAHYRRMFSAGLGDLIGQAATVAVPVAEFSGKTGSVFQLHLAAINDGHREGELTLKLMHQGQCIYASSFVLITLQDAPGIALGALQGLRSLEGPEVIKAATRELHGCRPKKLMVSVVRAIGEYLGCARILLVSNKNRITVNARRARRISSNYDETWEEMGALKRQDGNFELPCAAPGQNLELVASHKRAQARRRNALLGALCVTVKANLESRRLHAPRLAHGEAAASWQAGAAQTLATGSFEPSPACSQMFDIPC